MVNLFISTATRRTSAKQQSNHDLYNHYSLIVLYSYIPGRGFSLGRVAHFVRKERTHALCPPKRELVRKDVDLGTISSAGGCVQEHGSTKSTKCSTGKIYQRSHHRTEKSYVADTSGNGEAHRSRYRHIAHRRLFYRITRRPVCQNSNSSL